MRRNHIIGVLIGGGAVFLVVGVALAVIFLRGGAASQPPGRPEIPLATLTGIPLDAPSSIEDLVTEYPELSGILNDPELGTVYKEFLVAYQQGGIDAATELAKERGLLTPDGSHLMVTLVLDTEDPDALVAQLTGVGVEVVSVYRDRVNISVPVALIEQAMQSDDASAVFERLTELNHVVAVRLPSQRDSNQIQSGSEGVAVTGADKWHEAGITGAGIKIGVLDLGFSGYEKLLGSALPDNVEMQTFGWYDNQEVHGAACAEIVHEMAPDAELFFAWYDGSDAAMGEAVDWLMSKNVDIITHSAGGVISPRDGTGWDSQLVDQTTAQGVLWVNSAGNEADVHYRGIFNDTDGDGFTEFPSGSQLLPIYTNGDVRISLVWQDDWNRPTQDFELTVLDGNGDILGSSEDAQDGSPGQEPAEWVSLSTSESVVYAAMYAYAADQNVTFDIFASGPGVEMPDAVPAYSVNSPGDAVSSLTVGAVDWNDDVLAYYSSQGPTTDERLKPDISGPTGTSGAVYGRRAFDGTSSSAPHVAGAAALVWAAYPDFTRDDVMNYLLNSAVDLGPGGPDTGYGFGRLNLPAPPNGVIGQPTPTPAPGVSGATAVPGGLATATPVAFTTPVPVSAGTGRGAGSLLLVLLLLGGFGVGGGGLLLIGGILLITDLRSRRRQRPAPAPVPVSIQHIPQAPQHPEPPSPSVRQHGEVFSPTQPWLPTADAPDRPMHAPLDSQENHPAAAKFCPTCGNAVRQGAHFCAQCGASLGTPAHHKFCQYCGAPLDANSRFCMSCGRPV